MKKLIIIGCSSMCALKWDLKMKLTAFFLLVCMLQINATTYSQKTRISLDMKDVELSEVLNRIETISEFKFFVDTQKIDIKREVAIKADKEKIFDILDKLFRGTNITYEVYKKQILLKRLDHRPIQSKSIDQDQSAIEINSLQNIITGVVIDENGTPLPGANILEKGTVNGTQADFDGNFSIEVADNNAILVVSYVGFGTKEVALNGQTEISVTLVESAVGMDEVVVIGYGSVKKSDLTGSVSSITRKDIGDRQVSDLGALIQGKAAGVDVSQGSIRIRGVTTFNNTDPLIVIDGFAGGNLNSINPNDIESIEILKDASSTAIYGTRGANGVILITTKSGKTGELKIDFNTYTGLSFAPKKLDVLNANEYVDYALDALNNAGSSNIPKLLTPEVRNDITDWQDEVFSAATKHEVSLSLSGGTEKLTTFVSLGYRYDEDLTVNGPEHNNFYFRNKNTFHITDKFKVGQNASFNYTKNKGLELNSNDMLIMLPYIPVYDTSNINGLGYGDSNTQEDGTGPKNPVAWANLLHHENAGFNYQFNLWAELEPLKGLTYRFQTGISGYAGSSKNWNPQFISGGGIQSFNSSMSERSNYGITPLIEQYLTYSQTLGLHDLSVMAGNSWTRFGESGDLGIFGNSFPDFTVKNVYYANANGVLSQNYDKYSALSYFGRFNYQYNNKYLLTVNFRADGSPKFAPDNRWGYFPSLALAWKLHEEDFIRNLDVFDHLKLRAGWGKSGNDQIGNFMYLEKVWNTNVYYQLGDDGARVNGATVVANASGDIKWESTISKTLALDMSFLNNRLSSTVEYFVKNTNDILFGVPRPPSLGYGTNMVSGNAIVNAASVENKGFEFSLGYRGEIGNLGYRLNGNYSFVHNRVKSLGLGQPYINNINIVGSSIPVSRTDVGNPIGYFYGFVADGVFATQEELDKANSEANAKGHDYFQSAETKPGDVRFRDLDGDGQVDWDKDRTNLGSSIPKHNFGLTVSLDYKGFDLNAQFQGVADVSIMNGYYTGMRAGTNLWNQNSNVLNRWKSEADPGNGVQPRAVIGDPAQNNRPSSLWVSNGDYLKLRLLSLGYSLPKYLTNKIGLEQTRIYCSLDNFVTFTKYSQGFDPDVQATDDSSNLNRGIDNRGPFPNPKSIVFGIQINL